MLFSSGKILFSTCALCYVFNFMYCFSMFFFIFLFFYSFSVVFWFGDLNYRIDLPNETVRYLIEVNDYHNLVEHDQVRGIKIIEERVLHPCGGGC